MNGRRTRKDVSTMSPIPAISAHRCSTVLVIRSTVDRPDATRHNGRSHGGPGLIRPGGSGAVRIAPPAVGLDCRKFEILLLKHILAIPDSPGIAFALLPVQEDKGDDQHDGSYALESPDLAPEPRRLRGVRRVLRARRPDLPVLRQ